MSYPVRGKQFLEVRVSEPIKRKPRSPASSALDLLNPRFTLHVVDELREGERHFNDLSRSIPASINTLRQRLKLLETEGVLVRTVESYMPPSVSYRLTEKGQALADVVQRIGVWEADWLSKNPEQTASSQAAEERKPYGKKK